MQSIKSAITAILTWEARLVLLRYRPNVVAITGSVGKTTTKDAVYAAIASSRHVRKSEKSTNTDIGVPLTILGCANAWNNPFGWLWNILKGAWLVAWKHTYPEWLILEVGADRPGDIERIARWLRPDISIITGVPDIPSHVEYFKNVDEVFREKRTLAEHVRPGGKVIVNGDDPRTRTIEQDLRGITTTYGLENANYLASHISTLILDGVARGVQFRVNHEGSSVPVVVYGALGFPRVYAATAALAAADTIGVDFVTATKGLAEWLPPPGRTRLIEGVRGTIIIDDSYNSSPAAVLAALDALAEVPAKRRIAILGDMLELGKYTSDAHRQVGERAAKIANILITVGLRARTIAEAARDAGMPENAILQYERDESARAGDELEERLEAGDAILVKGSQGMRMEKTVLEIMAHPEQAPDLLVRQEAEWQRR